MDYPVLQRRREVVPIIPLFYLRPLTREASDTGAVSRR